MYEMKPASLGLRFVALLIDGICSIPLQFLGTIPGLGLLFAPALCLYWLSRDSFFGGQSIGKRVMGLRVIRQDGQAISWIDSVIRNITYLPLTLLMIPIIGVAIESACSVPASLLDLLLVLITSKRLGDLIGHTQVVLAQ